MPGVQTKVKIYVRDELIDIHCLAAAEALMDDTVEVFVDGWPATPIIKEDGAVAGLEWTRVNTRYQMWWSDVISVRPYNDSTLFYVGGVYRHLTYKNK